MTDQLLNSQNEVVIEKQAAVQRLKFQLALAESDLTSASQELARMLERRAAFDPNQLNAEERALALSNPIAAIKSLRARNTPMMGLKDAKDIVDDYRRQQGISRF